MKIKRFSARTPIALGVALGAAMAAQTARADLIEFTHFGVSQGNPDNKAVEINSEADPVPSTKSSATVAAPNAGDQRTINLSLTNGYANGAFVLNSYFSYNQDSYPPAGSRGSAEIVWNLSPCLDWTNATKLWIRSGQDHKVPLTVTIDGVSTTRSVPENGNVPDDYDFSISGDSEVCEVKLLVDGSQVTALDLDIDRIWVETETPPPPVVPAISALGLGASLIGLPLFAAGLARRRSRKQ